MNDELPSEMEADLTTVREELDEFSHDKRARVAFRQIETWARAQARINAAQAEERDRDREFVAMREALRSVADERDRLRDDLRWECHWTEFDIEQREKLWKALRTGDYSEVRDLLPRSRTVHEPTSAIERYERNIAVIRDALGQVTYTEAVSDEACCYACKARWRERGTEHEPGCFLGAAEDALADLTATLDPEGEEAGT